MISIFPGLLLLGSAPGSRAGTVAGTFSPIASGSNVDLTVAGKLDWVHWGLYTASSLDRKASVAPRIGNFTLIGTSSNYQTVYQFSDNANGYTWYDGMPLAGITNTTTGVWAYQYTPAGFSAPLGSGFQLTVPAGPTNETLLVYVGAYDAVGQFTATLSDGGTFTSAPGQTVNNMGSGPGGVFAVNFKANSAGQTLTVQWKVSTIYSSSANVTLQAAALTATNADSPPYVVITNPTNYSALPESNAIVLEATAQDFDGSVTNVVFYAGTNALGEVTASPYSLTWTNPPRGRYFVTAQALDNAGVAGYSQPVEIFVYGPGGGQTNSITTPPAASVDLTAEGTADWTHWGLTTNTSFDHKNLVPRQISDFTELGTNAIQQYANNYTSFAWSDGTPTPNTGGTTTGVFVYGQTNGFQLTAPADGFPRQLTVYVGGYGVQGELQAWLSDFSAPPLIDTASVNNVYGSSYVAYTINYTAAATNQQLIVVWRSLNLYDTVYGNVTLQAATLQSAAPLAVQITNPLRVENGFAFTFLTQTGRNYSVEYTDSLNPAVWQTLASFPGNGTSMSVTNQNPTSTTGFYRVLTQ